MLVLAGCVRATSVECPGGTVCAEGQLCVRASDTVTVCADPGARDLCAGAGIPDGETCGTNGRCYDGACLPIECGDRVVDPDRAKEQCDDGNNVPGDGCSADCSSDETCGNGVVDPLEGEICDDANLVGHDGCSGGCSLEQPRWSQIGVDTPPPDRWKGMAYLPGRGRVVMVTDDRPRPSTWEWNGTGWHRVPTTLAPGTRDELGAAPDPKRDVLAVFGGGDGFNTFTDLWELSADRWTLVTSTLRARTDPAAAYDSRRERVMMFGGRRDGEILQVYLDDLFAWDGATATEVVHVPTEPWPSARDGAMMVYDPRRDELVLFGGNNETGMLGDTWTLHGTTWTAHTGPGPSARRDGRMVVDGTGVFLYGGYNGTKGLDDGWRWDGTTWTSLGSMTPGLRIAPGLAYDSARGVVVLFGGVGNMDRQVWEWNGVKWSPITPMAPLIGEYAGAAFDPLRHQAMVVAGGATFALRDGSWASLGVAPAPSRAQPAMAYDTARDRAVMFGGTSNAGAALAETQVFAPSDMPAAWMRLITTTSPPARAAAVMAYDSARGVSVLFGGTTLLAELGDTWELDTDWHERTVSPAPPARSGAMMAYDPVRKQTVLFGGTAMGHLFGDTWIWNGAAWIEQHPVGRTPTARADATLTWNPGRRRVTLFGGRTEFLGAIDDTWEWTGSAWVEIATPTSPGGRAAHAAVPTSDGSGIHVIAGGAATGVLGDLWTLAWSEPDRNYERCTAQIDRDGDGATGCADPDCWWACTPLCPPTTSCAATAPRCGDMMVAPAETCQLCPDDVTACPMCGDFRCQPPETSTTCPGDCP